MLIPKLHCVANELSTKITVVIINIESEFLVYIMIAQNASNNTVHFIFIIVSSFCFNYYYSLYLYL